MAWLWTLALGVISLELVVGVVIVSRQGPEPTASNPLNALVPSGCAPSAHDTTRQHASSGHEGSICSWWPMGPAFEWTQDDDRQLMELLQRGARDSDPKKRAPFGFEGPLGDHSPGDRHRPER